MRFAVLIAMAVAVCVPDVARAESNKARCARAYEHAQELRLDQKLLAARDELAVCMETCAEALAAECRAWDRDAVEKLPGVMFRVSDREGRPLHGVRVTVDGGGASVDADASASRLAIDPGSHSFRFEHPGFDAQDTTVVLQAGERRREIAVTLIPTRASPTATPALALLPAPSDAGHSPAPSPAGRDRTTYLLAAVGAGLAVVGAGLAITGDLDESHLRSTCAPHCSVGSIDTVRGLWIGGAIAGAIGVASLVVAFVRWSSAPTSSQRSPPRSP